MSHIKTTATDQWLHVSYYNNSNWPMTACLMSYSRREGLSLHITVSTPVLATNRWNKEGNKNKRHKTRTNRTKARQKRKLAEEVTMCKKTSRQFAQYTKFDPVYENKWNCLNKMLHMGGTGLKPEFWKMQNHIQNASQHHLYCLLRESESWNQAIARKVPPKALVPEHQSASDHCNFQITGNY